MVSTFEKDFYWRIMDKERLQNIKQAFKDKRERLRQEHQMINSKRFARKK